MVFETDPTATDRLAPEDWRPQRLRADGTLCARTSSDRSRPIVTTPTPALSWEVPLVRQGQQQTGFEIRVGTSMDPVSAPDLWSSGLVESAENRGVRWDGALLQPYTRAAWSIRVRDERGELSAWSETVPIEVGPLSSSDWRGEWITVAPTHAATATVVRNSDVPVVFAVVSFAALGSIRTIVAGQVINGDHYDPTDSSLERATVREYDVTDVVAASDGRFRVEFIAGLGHLRRILDRPRLTAQVRIDYADGTRQWIGSDTTWSEEPTSLIIDDPFYLEVHDSRCGPRDRHERVTKVPDDAKPPLPNDIVPDGGPPVRVVREVVGRLIGRPSANTAIFDLGENVAARVRLSLRRTRPGQVVESVQGEKLTADGFVDTTNIRLPDDRDRERQVLRWICSGGDVVAEPWFGVHGFRYVEVRGAEADRVDVVARVLHSDVEQTGSLLTASDRLTALVDMAVRTQLNNTHGYPEDCPTREQGGWTGDASVSAEAALAHLDLTGVYRRWLADVALDMSDSGGVPGLSPAVIGRTGEMPADPVWGSALTEIPWRIWRTTGDLTLVESLVAPMRRWVEWQLDTLQDGVVRHADISYGADWLALEQTPPVLLQTAAVVTSLRALADLEEAGGNIRFAETWRTQADLIVTAARSLLCDAETGLWANGSQASYALALVTGLVTEEEQPGIVAALLERLQRCGGRLATGFAGTRPTVQALADIDGGSALLDFVDRRDQPGIGAMLEEGPGTLWETWWMEDEHLGVASLDHIGLAAPFAAWVWRDVAGLRILEAGFRRFAIEPRMTDRVRSATFAVSTVRGRIGADWSLHAGRFRCAVTVPVGAIAEIVVPGRCGQPTVDGRPDHPLAHIGRDEEERTIVRLPAGEYVVVAEDVEPIEAVVRHALPRRVETTSLWLSDGVSSSWHPQQEGTRVTVRRDPVWCAPVFHEAIPAPTLDIEIADLLPDVDALVVLEQDGILDLEGARAVFAFLDIDNAALPGSRLDLVMCLHSADGSTRRASARPLPVQWNRVAVDVSEWPGRSTITSVEVGLRSSGHVADDSEPDRAHPFAYRIGRVGWSDVAPTY